MAWPDPFVPGDPLTAAELNGIQAIGAAWTTDPRSAATIWKGATGNPAIGNGTLTSRYLVRGQTFEWKVKIVAGSTTTFGTGQWSLVPPFSLRDIGFAYAGYAVDSSTSNRYRALFEGAGPTSVLCWVVEATAGGPVRAVTSAVPFTWATGDVLSVQMTLENS